MRENQPADLRSRRASLHSSCSRGVVETRVRNRGRSDLSRPRRADLPNSRSNMRRYPQRRRFGTFHDHGSRTCRQPRSAVQCRPARDVAASSVPPDHEQSPDDAGRVLRPFFHCGEGHVNGSDVCQRVLTSLRRRQSTVSGLATPSTSVSRPAGGNDSVLQDLFGRVLAAGAHHAAPWMTGRATQVQATNRRAMIGPARQGPAEK